MLYVYAVADELQGADDLTGVQGESLQVIPLDDAVAIAGEVAARPALTAEALKAQDALVRRLHERAAALLPMRFGITASNRADLSRALAAREGLFERLAAVRGCEQMIVRVLGATGATGSVREPRAAGAMTASGTEYLRARAAQYDSTLELQTIAHAAAGLRRDVRIEPAQQPGVHGSVYHLIERGSAAEYRAAIEETAAMLRGVRVIVSGPSPPYAFA